MTRDVSNAAFPQRRRKMQSVCFVGIDGTGKTTQAELLLETLHACGVSTKYVHVLSQEATVSARLQETRVGNLMVRRIRNLRDSRVGSSIKLVLRGLNVLGDAWITVYWHKVRYRSKMILYDRYFYDIVVLLAYSYPHISDKILRLAKLIPRPNVIILFDASPESVVGRKHEHSLSEAQQLCQLYRDLGRVLSVEVVNSELSVEEVAGRIKKLCKEGMLL